MIDELRVATIRHFTRRLASDAREEGDLRAAVATVVDRQLAMLAVTRLSAIARKFALEYASRRASLEEAMRFADGTLFWPLFPSEFLTADGLRKVTPLATRDELRAEGTLQDLCIKGGSELTRMIAACASGRTFLVSVRDAITETRLSTAEIHLSRAMRGGMLEVGIRQHRAAGNAQPSLGCASALREALVAVGSREVQDHLAEGQRMAWKRRMLTESTEVDADEAVLRETLRIALGERLYEALAIVATQRESRSTGS